MQLFCDITLIVTPNRVVTILVVMVQSSSGCSGLLSDGRTADLVVDQEAARVANWRSRRSALSQAIRQLEARLRVRLLNRTTRSVSLTEAGEAYLARVGPALGQVIEAREELNVLQGRPAGTLRLNAARISTALVLQPMLAGFLQENPHVQLELTNDEGFVDIVEKGFVAGVRIGESLHRDMVAVPLGGPITVAVVASPEYLRRIPAPRHPDELARHNCVRFRFAGTGMIHKWEFQVDG